MWIIISPALGQVTVMEVETVHSSGQSRLDVLSESRHDASIFDFSIFDSVSSSLGCGGNVFSTSGLLSFFTFLFDSTSFFCLGSDGAVGAWAGGPAAAL